MLHELKMEIKGTNINSITNTEKWHSPFLFLPAMKYAKRRYESMFCIHPAKVGFHPVYLKQLVDNNTNATIANKTTFCTHGFA